MTSKRKPNGQSTIVLVESALRRTGMEYSEFISKAMPLLGKDNVRLKEHVANFEAVHSGLEPSGSYRFPEAVIQAAEAVINETKRSRSSGRTHGRNQSRFIRPFFAMNI